MEKDEICFLIKNLALGNKLQNQKSAMSQLTNLKNDEIRLLILPGSDKKSWKNAALVLKQIGYPRIKPVVFDLLDWLQDINWPGSHTIIDLLSTVDKSVLVNEIEKKLDIEVIDDVPIRKDDMWLGAFFLLIKKMNLKEKDFNNKDKFDLINSSDYY